MNFGLLRLTALNFIFLNLVFSIFLMKFLFPSLFSYQDFSIIRSDNYQFGFGRFHIDITFFIIKLFLIALFSSFIARNLEPENKFMWVFCMSLININLILWITNLGEIIIFPFGIISWINLVILLSLFYGFWRLVIYFYLHKSGW